MLTPKTAAPLLGVSPRRVLDFIRDGRLKAENLGGEGRGARWVMQREDVEALAAQERCEGRPRIVKP